MVSRSAFLGTLFLGYRYTFNGKENDGDVKGDGDQIDYGMRVFAPRLGKFLSLDPLQRKYPELSPYNFASNNPIAGDDLDGQEFFPRFKQNDPLSLTAWSTITTYNRSTVGKIVNNSAKGIKISTLKAYQFITSDIRHWSTYKNIGSFLEEGIFDMSTVKVAPSPRIDAMVQEFKENVIDGDVETRSEFIAETLTDFGIGFLTDKGISKLANLKWSAELKSGTQIAGVSFGKKIARKALAEKVFSSAGKSAEEVSNLMNTIDYTRPVREVVLNKGDKIWRFERTNAQAGASKHFYTDAYGADAGPEGVGFESSSGYKLVEYEVTQQTTILESTIRSTRHKQFFSANLENNIKPINP